MKVKVSLIGLADMLKFKHLKDNRLKAIDETEIKPIQRHKINDLADYYHPKKQYLVLDKIVDENETTKSFLFKPDESMGTKKLAYFKSGSYVSLYVGIGDSIASRAYAISSSPKEALEGIYRITIKRKEGGFVSEYMLDQAKVGDKITYTLTLSNSETASMAIENAVVTDVIPSGLTFEYGSVMLNGSGTSDFTYDENTRLLTVNVGSIEPDTSRTVSFVSTVNEDAYNTTIQNLATLTSNNTEPVQDKDDGVVVADGMTDLSIEKSISTARENDGHDSFQPDLPRQRHSRWLFGGLRIRQRKPCAVRPAGCDCLRPDKNSLL